jgi:phosphoesterase RecJ-like protein
MGGDIQKFKELIEKARRILVTTHNGPDGDAWSSLSIVKIALERYLGRKNVEVKVVGSTREGKKVEIYEKLNDTKIIHSLEQVDLKGFDLIIITDAQSVERCIPKYENLEPEVSLVSLDHHQLIDSDIAKLLLNFNQFRSSAAEEVFRVFRDMIGDDFAKDVEIVDLAQRGIVSDTYRFLFPSTSPETYELMAELTRVHRLDMERYMQEMTSFPPGSIKAMAIMLKNFKKEGDMAYITITAQEMNDSGISELDRDEASQFLINGVVRDIDGVDWGFAMRESLNTPGKWTLSFRANNGTREVVEIAKLLEGGGHKYAAGAIVHADNLESALEKVFDAIKKTEVKG